MGVMIAFIAGGIAGIVLMCLLQANRINEINFKIRYLKKVCKTNRKGNSEYDKGYSDGLEYACTLLEEEKQ